MASSDDTSACTGVSCAGTAWPRSHGTRPNRLLPYVAWLRGERGVRFRRAGRPRRPHRTALPCPALPAEHHLAQPAIDSSDAACSTKAAQLAALLRSDAGKALLQRRLTAGATASSAAAPAASKTAQLAALLATDAGKALLQRHLQRRQAAKQQHVEAAPTSPECTSVPASAATQQAQTPAAPEDRISRALAVVGSSSPKAAAALLKARLLAAAGAAAPASSGSEQCGALLPLSAGVFRDNSLDSSDTTTGGGHSNSQLVFRRRGPNSAALRRHFSNATKAAGQLSAGKPVATTPARPQQVFKKQRKRPLVLWQSSSTNLAAAPQALPSAMDAELSESSGVAASGTVSFGCAAAAQPHSVSSVEAVLSALASQEAALLALQQQLRQQRALIQSRREEAAAKAAAHDPLQQLAAAAAAQADVDMADAAQQEQLLASESVAHGSTVSALVAIARSLAARQQAAMAAPALPAAQPGWRDDVVGRLTAALLAA